MYLKVFTLSWTVLLLLSHLLIVNVNGETTWVWSSNRNPQSSSGNNNNNNNGGSLSSNNFQNQNPNFGQTNLGSSDRFNSGKGSSSIFPESPSRRKKFF